MITRMEVGKYTAANGCTYEIESASDHDGLRSGYMTMSNPTTGHGWGGYVSEREWLLDVARYEITKI